MKLLFAVLTTAALLQEPAAKTGGKLEWGRDVAAAEKRARLEQRAMFLYFTDNGMPSRALDAGAFSHDTVIASTKGLFPVIVECPDDKAHADLRTRFKVSGFPTLMILEPDGKTQHEIGTRETAELAAELAKAAKKFPGRVVLWLSSMETALETAKKDRKPLAVYIHPADEDLAAAQERLVKIGGQSRIDKYVWLELSATNEDKDPNKQKYEFYSLPAIAFVDPRFPEPKRFGVFELEAKAKPKELQDKLEERLKKYKATKVK
jgi:hypothetical protein